MIWVLLGFLLVCSGMVSACETALFGLSRATLHEFRTSNTHAHRRVADLMLHPRRALLTILITNTGVNVAFFAVSYMALEDLRAVQPALGIVAGIGTLLMVIVFGEMLPKALALSRAQVLAPRATGVVIALRTVLAPVRGLLGTFLVNPMTRLLEPVSQPPSEIGVEELQTLVDQSAREGIISSNENHMLQAVVAMADARVREVMTPRVDMKTLTLNQRIDSASRAFLESGQRRLPVHGRDADDIVGMVHLRDLRLHPDKHVGALLKKVQFVPEQANLLQVLRRFRHERTEAAIVVDEYGGTAGFVTVEDVTERTVGSAASQQEASRSPATRRIDDNTYRLSGDLSVREWALRFGVRELDRHVDTVAGLILAKLGRVPSVGECVRIGNLTLTVERMEHRRIDQVLLRRDAPEQHPASAEHQVPAEHHVPDSGSSTSRDLRPKAPGLGTAPSNRESEPPPDADSNHGSKTDRRRR